MAIPASTRSTRTSSATPTSPPPTTRSSRLSTLSANTDTSTPATRKLGWNSSLSSTAKPRVPTRSSTATPSGISTPRPLWGSTKANTEDPGARSSRPSSAVGKASPAVRKTASAAATRSSLAPPRAGSRQASLAPGRESVATPAGEMLPPATPARTTVDKGGVENYDPTREAMKVSSLVRVVREPCGEGPWTRPSIATRRSLNPSLAGIPPYQARDLSPAGRRLPARAERLRGPHGPTSRLSSPLATHLLTRRRADLPPSQDHRLGPSASSFSLHAPPATDTTNPPTPQGTLYKFTSVADASASSGPGSQAQFFRETTLPLVRDFLQGENCLLFAYGPTGSGKTWTVQGGDGEDAGLLPRVMDVVWRSLQGRESRSNVSRDWVADVQTECTDESWHDVASAHEGWRGRGERHARRGQQGERARARGQAPADPGRARGRRRDPGRPQL